MSSLTSGSGITGLISTLTNGAASGTGIVKLVPMVKKMLNLDTIPQYLVDYAMDQQHSLFGDYPSSKDVAPSAIFTAVFFILFCGHMFIFFKNYSRGHKFWLSLGFAFYCILRVIGFAMRIAWAKNIQSLLVGIASEVFLIVPIVLLASYNLVLAQRIFTWRHPRLGSSKWFWTCMITLYVIVAGVVVMAICGQVLPYLYFMSEKHFNMCKKVARAAALLCVLYSVCAAALVIFAFVLKPTTAASNIWTYQPWWIEQFGMFYYVPKGAAQQAERSFEERDPECTAAVRTIPSTKHYHNTLEKTMSVTSKSGQLEHNHSIFIIALTTFIVLLSSAFRCASTFIDNTYASQSWIFKPVVMYIMFGLLETIVNVVYLTSRVDLRFYRPDKLKPEKVGNSRKSSAAGIEGDTLTDGRSRDENKPYADVANNDHSSYTE